MNDLIQEINQLYAFFLIYQENDYQIGKISRQDLNLTVGNFSAELKTSIDLEIKKLSTKGVLRFLFHFFHVIIEKKTNHFNLSFVLLRDDYKNEFEIFIEKFSESFDKTIEKVDKKKCVTHFF